jgi:hypothetical protein
MNPEFILWYDNVSTLQLIITIIFSIIAAIPIIFLITGIIALMFHTDSNDFNNDSDGCL